MSKPERNEPELFLMSPPGTHWQLRGRANFRSDKAAQVDPQAAFQEWYRLAKEIDKAGGKVIVLPAAEAMTGLPYCAEAGHALAPQGSDPKPRFLLPRMWAPHRKEESSLWLPLVESLGFCAIKGEAGYWEGQGDVASFRETEILFWGGRTDAAGLAAYRSFFSDKALAIEIRQPAFHGNVALLCVDACNCILVCPDLIVGDGMERLKERFGADALLLISEEEAKSYATNSLPVGKSLLAPSIAPERVTRELESRGMHMVSLDMRELCEKAGGASRCLVCRIPASIGALLDTCGGSGLSVDLETLAEQRREEP